MRFLCASLIASALLTPSLALACSTLPLPHSQLHEVDPSLQATDQSPPTVQVSDFEFKRPDPEVVDCRSPVTSSCDGFRRYFSVPIHSAQDDQTPPDQIGYLIEVVEGKAPSAMRVSFATEEEHASWRDPATQPIRLPDNLLRFSAKLDPEDSGRIDFTLKITPVDLAGNVGEPAFLHVTDPNFPEGCQSVGARSNLPPLLAALALLLAQRAARRLRSAGDSVPRTP